MTTSRISLLIASGVAAVSWWGGPGVASAGHHQEAAPETEPTCERVGDPTASSKTLGVDLREWSVSPEAAEAGEGMLTLLATNAGIEPHELVVVKAERAKDLPTSEDGVFDEEAFGEENIVGEIEAFPSGEDCSGTFHLDPDSYVLLCNIVEEEADGSLESHYRLGMHTKLTVTPDQ